MHLPFEGDKRKQAAKRMAEYTIRKFDPNWQIKEWFAFRYVGLPLEGRLILLIISLKSLTESHVFHAGPVSVQALPRSRKDILQVAKRRLGWFG